MRFQSKGGLFHFALSQFLQEFIRRHEERVLLQDAPDDDHRVRAHDVHDDLCSKLEQVVCSADGVVILGQYEVQAGFVLHDVIDAGAVLQCPFHVGNQPGQRIALGFAAM